jgi:hypothetical protein
MSHPYWLIHRGVALVSRRPAIRGVVMSPKRILAVLVAVSLLVTAVSLGAVVSRATAATPGCPDTRIFQLGGHGDPDAHVFNASNANLPPGVDYKQVHYSASFAPYPGDAVPADASVAEGTTNLLNEVRGFHGECPDSQIKVAGYSEGGISAARALAELAQDPTIPHNLIDGVLYAYAQGPSGLATTMSKIIPGLSQIPGLPVDDHQLNFGDIKVAQPCNADDLICNAPDPLKDPAGFIKGIIGYFEPGGPHVRYNFDPNNVDTSAAVQQTNDPASPIGPAPSAELGNNVPQLTQVLNSLPQAANVPQLTQTLGNLPQLLGNLPQLAANLPQLAGNLPQLLGNLPQLLGNIPQLVSTFAPIVANLAGAFAPFASLASAFAPVAAGTGNLPLAAGLTAAPGVTVAVGSVANLVGAIAAQFGGQSTTPAAQNGLAQVTSLLTNAADVAAPLVQPALATR